ncbi:MAG: DNA polymerase I [Flavobacteriales bacterium]|nr:DNA polymerase I [Flavobacteriales bacterium]
MITKGDKKLFLIDAYALIYRAYFAFSKNPRITSKGFDTSAIYGFTNMLMDLINTEKPAYLGVVFDTPKKTHRHVEYIDYKANRDAMPEGIATAIPYIKKILQSFNIPALSLDGFEADDVIGTLAKQAAGQEFQTYMMTPDKDFAQLVTDSTFMYKPGSRGNPSEVWDVNRVCEKFDINNVSQVIDFLGMVGDSVDNIPGIVGVGPKTSSKLLKQYNSIEQIYNSINELDGKLKEKLMSSKDNAFLSKSLATIITNAPINLDPVSLKRQAPNLNALKDICDELEFSRIYNRLTKNYTDTKQHTKSIVSGAQLDMFNIDKELDVVINKGKHIRNIEELKDVISSLIISKIVGFYILYNDEKPIGLSVTSSTNYLAYMLFDKDLQLKQVLTEMLPIFNSNKIEKVFWDYKSFLKSLAEFNINCEAPIFDATIADYLINPDSNRSHFGMAQKYDIQLINLGLLDVKIEEQATAYLIEMAIFILNIKPVLFNLLDKNTLLKLFFDVELPLVPVLIQMEQNGILLDTKSLSDYSQTLKTQLGDLEKNIFKKADCEFNISSPKQLGEILFVNMKLVEKPKKTKSGQFSTSESELAKLKGKHSIIDDILLFRTYQKLLSTYVNALPLLIDAKDKKLHTTFNQTVTNTGRLSSKNPNLQNIPIRKSSGKDVRKTFIASNSQHILMAADYSQIELRLIAHLSDESNLIQAFLNDQDIHSITASKVFNVNLEDVTSEMRSNAKTVNFGIIYGVSAFGLSEQSTLSRKESANLISEYFIKYPKLKIYIDDQINFAKNNGFVQSILGRKRYLRNINSRNSFIRSHDERNAVNMPIQGSAADIIKIAMISIHQEFASRKMKSKMVLQVHDELVFDVFLPEKEEVMNIVKRKMESAYDAKVPLKVDIGFGNNWLSAH